METKRVVVKVQSNPTISVKDYKEDYIRQRPEDDIRPRPDDDIRPENKDIPQLLSKTTASRSNLVIYNLFIITISFRKN